MGSLCATETSQSRLKAQHRRVLPSPLPGATRFVAMSQPLASRWYCVPTDHARSEERGARPPSEGLFQQKSCPTAGEGVRWFPLPRLRSPSPSGRFPPRTAPALCSCDEAGGAQRHLLARAAPTASRRNKPHERVLTWGLCPLRPRELRWGAMGWSSTSGSSRTVVLLHPHSWDAQVMGNARYPRSWGRCFQRCNLVPAFAEHPQFLCGGTGKSLYTTQCLNPHHEWTRCVVRLRGHPCHVHWVSLCPTLPRYPVCSSDRSENRSDWSWSAAGATPPPSHFGTVFL